MCDCLRAVLECLYLISWPIVSVVLGIFFGSIVGAAISVIIFTLTLVRTPMHVYKMMRVTATTDECFKGHLGTIMRISVFFLVPIPHLVFLLAITAFAATVGVLHYVGKASQVLYNHEYKKAFKQVESNARLEPKSYLGKYVKKCQEYMADDTKSYDVIFFLKGCCAMVPGFFLGSIPFIPFTLLIVLVTLVRLPINVYKTLKVTLFTVLLKWDLRILALVTLPVVHTLFPVIVFIITLAASFWHFTFRTWKNIYKGKSPFHKWDFRKGVDEYYKCHQKFVGEVLNDYDHPTGIPNGWQGDTYGIPVVRILRWQRDFLLCCIFTVYGICVSLCGTIVLSVCKFVPSVFYMWQEITKEYLDQSAVKIMGTWPFYLAGMCLLPVGMVLFFAGLVVASFFMALRVPWEYIEYGYRAALHEPFMILKDLDKWSKWCSGDWCLFVCLSDESDSHAGYVREDSNQSETASEARQRTVAFWVRFVSQSIKTTSELVKSNWVALDDVQSLDPSVVQSIPGVTVLTILADSAKENDLDKEDIKWNVDGTVCKRKDRPVNDGIVSHLWPLAFEVKKMLLANDGELAEAENVKVIAAMICSNSEEDTDDLREFLTQAKAKCDQNYARNNLVRTKINEIVLRMCRTKPYQDRMGSIFSFDYDSNCEEGGFQEKKGKDGSADDDASLILNIATDAGSSE